MFVKTMAYGFGSEEAKDIPWNLASDESIFNMKIFHYFVFIFILFRNCILYDNDKN